MSAERAQARSRRPASSASTTTSRRRAATTTRSRRPSATRAGSARSTRSRRPASRPASAASSTSARRPSSGSRWRSSWPRSNPTSVPINLLNPRPGTKFGDRDLIDPWEAVKLIAIFRLILPERAVPALRRARREPRRAAAARRQGRPERRDDGQLPHHARLRARGGPRDVRGARPERRAPARQRRQPAARQPLRLARGRDAAHADRRADRHARHEANFWDPATQLRVIKKQDASVPPRPGRRAERLRRGGPSGAGGVDERHRGAPRGAPRARALPAHAAGLGPAGPARAARRQAGAAALLEQLPRPRRPPARARGGRRGGDALRRRRRRVAAGLGQHDAPPPARGAARRLQGHRDARCCSAPATWRTRA